MLLWQGENVTCIYSSPFMRTLQTAHQVAQVLDLPVLIEPGLCEGMLPRTGPPLPTLSAFMTLTLCCSFATSFSQIRSGTLPPEMTHMLHSSQEMKLGLQVADASQ